MSTDKHRLIPITDLHTPELEIYNERREVQLFHYYEPERGLFIAESPNVILRALAAGYEPLSLLMEQREADSEKGREILGRIAEVSGEIPVYVASNAVLSEISGFKLARGMLCAMRRRALPKMEDLCGNARRMLDFRRSKHLRIYDFYCTASTLGLAVKANIMNEPDAVTEYGRVVQRKIPQGSEQHIAFKIFQQ